MEPYIEANIMIDDDALAARFRERLLVEHERKVLIAKLTSSRSATDPYTLVNCGGYGRVRVFKDYKLYLERAVFPDRPLRPNFRGYPPKELVRTQVFQLAACNWRCWYCFVDDNRLSADRRTSRYFTASDLLDLYLAEQDPPGIIDLSGGQPDLVPEWTLWMVDECSRRGIQDNVYIWIDDNLSNDYLFRYLSTMEIERMAATPKLSRMGCFKGFDEESFAFTTLVDPDKFGNQFLMARRIIDAGFQFYAYATFTAPNTSGIAEKMRRFVDRLQLVHELLPLRTTPLKVYNFATTKTRLDEQRSRSLTNQLVAYQIWDEELRRRFPPDLVSLRPDEL
jgi:uncharacterized Fe-S cluster-containing radical SAM superfamily protein